MMNPLRLKESALTAIAAWALTSAALAVPRAARERHSWVERGICPRGDATYNLEQLGSKLSEAAEIYFPGSTEFDLASMRWSVLEAPTVNVVVVPGTADDVAKTVKFANKKKLPFLAFNGAHGSITTLGRMDHGIEIYLSQLSSVEIAEDGETATIGGGTLSKAVTDALWDAGKQTVTGTCECVSLMGPALGGGHGWLQGHHGLVADQFVSMDVVLANGSLKTISESSHPDLWWAMKGAGHNFGIVTSVTTKIYGIEHSDWAMTTLIFTGDKVEQVYQAANDQFLQDGAQPVDVINWSYWFNDASLDPSGPVIAFYIIQEGVTTVSSAYTDPFAALSPIVVAPVSGTYRDLAAWTGISTADPPCQKVGLANPRFPIYLPSYNATAQGEVYSLFASATTSNEAFYNSLFMFEGYSMQGVQSIPSSSSAFAYREDNLLVAPLLSYTPDDAGELDAEAAVLGNQLRDILHEGSQRSELHAYVNYAYGDETPEAWYGSEEWRQARLEKLKKRYDPKGRFSFYGPIA